MAQSKWLHAGVAGFISLIVYLLTMAPTVSFWDCGEFIASAWTLGIPHPPGTPFFVIIARVAMLMFSFVGEKAARVNLISVITSAATIYICFLIVWDVLEHYFLKLKEKAHKQYSEKFAQFLKMSGAYLGAGFVAFSDTFWFNAVEAEVYGLAMAMVFLITWMSILWLKHKDDALGDKILVLICYIAFLGVGVHLYSMITLPVVFLFLIVMDPRMRKIESVPIWISGLALYTIVFMIDKFVYISLTTLVVSIAIILLAKTDAWKRSGRLTFWITFMAIVGYSTHAYIPIRSSLNPIIDENNPEIAMDKVFSPSEWGAFNDFLGRKQYGSESMLSRSFHRRGDLSNQFFSYPHLGYGGYLLAQLTPFKVGEARVDGQGKVKVHDQDNLPLTKFGVEVPTQMNSSFGESKFMQFLMFVIMHLFIFYGIWRLYKLDNRYGGYLGLLYLVCSVGLVWYMNFADGTGAERIDYQNWVQGGSKSGELNRVHMEVRERDYFFTPAFILAAMMLAISFSVFIKDLWLKQQSLQVHLKKIVLASIAFLIVIPVYSNYEEHDRSGLYVPWDYAYNLIQSCEPNSILFTNGDNDTFPLWFIQEVEGIRKDVRVVNLSLGNTPWYIDQILKNEPKKKLNFLGSKAKDVYPIYSKKMIEHYKIQKSWMSTEDFLGSIAKTEQTLKDAIATLNVQMAVLSNDSNLQMPDSVLALAKIELGDKTVEGLKATQKMLISKWQIYDGMAYWQARHRKTTIQVQDQLVFDLVRSNPETPIHFATTVQTNTYMGLEKFMKMDGMVWTLKRGNMDLGRLGLNLEKTIQLVDSVYQFRGLGDESVYINPETSRLMTNYLQIYSRIAQSSIELAKSKGLASEEGAKILSKGLSYLDKGLKEFPTDFQAYRLAAEFYIRADKKDKATEVLELGKTKVPKYAIEALEAMKVDLSQPKGKL